MTADNRPHRDDEDNRPNEDGLPAEESGEQPEDELVVRQQAADQENAEPEQGFLSRIWNSKTMTPVRIPYKVGRIATSPVWWPLKMMTKGLYAVNKPLGIVFGLVAAGVSASAVAYGLAYATVAANDMTSFLNWPATQGQWKGDITRFSRKGTFPCISYEGNLRTGEAADQEVFSIRQFDTELIEGIQNIPQDVTEVTLVYRDNGISQESFDSNPFYGCIQNSDHTVVGVHYVGPGGPVHIGVSLN